MEFFEAVVWGLLAGLIGTIILTLSETIEMKVTGRKASMVPGQVGYRITGNQPDNQRDLKRVSTGVHWAHGIMLGAIFGLLSLLDLDPAIVTALFFGVVWLGDVSLYKVLGIAQWPWKWPGSELAIDLFNKGVYAAATGVAFALLT